MLNEEEIILKYHQGERAVVEYIAELQKSVIRKDALIKEVRLKLKEVNRALLIS